MRLLLFVFLSVAVIGTATPEEVEVVESIFREDPQGSQDKNQQDTDQQAMESSNPELPQASQFNNLSPPKQNHIPSPPTRRKNGAPQNDMGLVPPPQPQKPYFEKHRLKQNVGYLNPPPPIAPPQQPQQAMDKYGSGNDVWIDSVADMPKVISLDVKCEKNLMKVYLSFDKPFFGIVFSKGHFSNVNCVHLPAGLGRTSVHFQIGVHECGTAGNTENGLYGYGSDSGSGSYFENIIVIQYDPQVQEVWDQARKLRCTWHDQYEKSVTFRPFPVDMLDVVRADFAGDNVGCWMQIQIGKGPWASEVSGLVKIGQTMTMVLAIKDDDSKFDMLVRNCMAHDGKRAPIQLVDQKGCVTRPKLMSRFTKIKNFGASASVLSYAHFQAFKFPDSMEVHFQCTIQICRYQCPDQCSDPNVLPGSDGHNSFLEVHAEAGDLYEPPHQSHPSPLSLGAYLQHPNRAGRLRNKRNTRNLREISDPEKEVGVNKIIRVVSTGDFTFSFDENVNTTTPPTMVFAGKDELSSPGLICMTTPGFTLTLMILLAILIISCVTSTLLCFKLRPFISPKCKQAGNLGNLTCNRSVDPAKKGKSWFYMS